MKSIYSKKAKKIKFFLAFLKVGATGFEPATTCSQNRSATGLRYTPLITYAIYYQRRKSRGDRIRTCDHLFPKQERYRAALHPALFSQQFIFVSVSIISELRVQRYVFFLVPPNF